MKIAVFYDHIEEAARQNHIKPVKNIYKNVRSFGIDAVELDYERAVKEEASLFKNLKEADFSVSCMYGFFDFAHGSTVEDGRRMVDFAEKHDIRRIMLIPGFLKKVEFIHFLYQKKLDKMIMALKDICGYAKRRNIMVVLEDFDGKEAPFATAEQLSVFLKRIPDLYCAFDTGNFLYSGEDSLKVLPLFIDRIRHVHCKDRSFTAKEGEEPKETVDGKKMYSCAVGSGCIQMKEILDQIIASGYDGYLSIEHFGSLDQLSDMERSAAYLKNFCL